MAVATSGRAIGAAVHRKEDRRLLTGRGCYVDDVTFPGLLHAAFVRSEVARARVTRIDTTAARQLPGVVAVYTAADLEGRYFDTRQSLRGEEHNPPPLAVADVRYVGDPIVMIVAESRYLAEDACELVEVDIDIEPACVDYRRAADPAQPVVHGADGETSNVRQHTPWTATSDDLDAVFASAAHVVELDIEQHRYLCVPIETRGIVASWVPGRDELDVACSTQAAHGIRNFLAGFLDLPEANVRVQARDVGGGFGQKIYTSREESAVVLATRLLGRPVKWIEDRRENLMVAPHSRNEHGVVRLALDADGAFLAITVDYVADAGAYPPSPAAINARLLPGPYRTPALGFSTTLVWTNTTGRGAYRGPWLFETTAREMIIDHAARVIGADPLELRRKQLLSTADLPHALPGGAPVLSEVTPRECFEAAIEAFDVRAFRAEQERARAAGRWLGLGCAVFVEPTSGVRPGLATEAATVRIEESGKVVAFVGTSSSGNSVETTMAQIVADTLGAAYDDVTVIQGDTATTPYGAGTRGSRTAVVSGGAVHEASKALRDQVLAVAAEHLEADPADLRIEGGRVFVAGAQAKAITLADVAASAYMFAEKLPPSVGAGLESSVRFRPTRFPTFSNAAHLCAVEIDPSTLITTVLRYVVAEDCGTIINPNVVDGQIFGGVVQGLGGVLLEDFVYDDDGNPLTTTFVDYLLPTTTEVPDIEVRHLETPSSTNPGGHKGMGEGGAIGAHAAVVNAVADALAPLGVVVTKTPLGPNDIHRLLVAAGHA